ncbi:MAG: hypothetical protein IOC66_02235 [Burkholderia sp.]|jgi:hypothetical protein|nr:hypothetical protein [Burkholderia sp.]
MSLAVLTVSAVRVHADAKERIACPALRKSCVAEPIRGPATAIKGIGTTGCPGAEPVGR